MKTYREALRADLRLSSIDDMVNAMCAAVGPDDLMCHGCVWEHIVKPRAQNAIGWNRRPGKQKHPDEVEAWLRSSHAWDTVTDAWLHKLIKADPGNGHGLSENVLDAAV